MENGYVQLIILMGQLLLTKNKIESYTYNFIEVVFYFNYYLFYLFILPFSSLGIFLHLTSILNIIRKQKNRSTERFSWCILTTTFSDTSFFTCECTEERTAISQLFTIGQIQFKALYLLLFQKYRSFTHLSLIFISHSKLPAFCLLFNYSINFKIL